MTLNQAMRFSGSGMVAERTRMDVISANIANANSMKTPDQDAYRRQSVVLTGSDQGVKVSGVLKDMGSLRAVPDPSNPFADDKGYVYFSNVEPVTEMVNLMTANRSYEANIAAFNSVKSMVRAAMNIGKV